MFCSWTRPIWATACVLALLPSTLVSAGHGLKSGNPNLKHAGPLAFGPDGILLVGDSLNAAVYAIDTKDTTDSSAVRAPVNIEGVNKKIAAMVGSSPAETVINDMVVNPKSGNIYLSVARGRGPDSIPLIFKVDTKGEVSEFSLEKVEFAHAKFDNAPKSGRDRRGRNPRMNAITDIQFNSGKVFVAGLSNEEFASKLRAIDFPFTDADPGASVEIFHGAHGKLETRSPVRTFVPLSIGGEPHVVAAYTCTPLVKFPVSSLKSGEKVQGVTVAELGNRDSLNLLTRLQ